MTSTGHWLPRLRALIGGALLLGLSLQPAAADLPRFCAGLGAGAAKLFQQEYTGGAPRSAGWDRYSAGVWWGDLSWSFRSRVMVGLRAHLLRVPLREGERLGTLDLFPAVVQIGYHHPGLFSRMRGFVALGAGMAWTRFVADEGSGIWRGTRDGTIRISAARPLVLSLAGGMSYELERNFLIELAVSSVFMDAQVAYRSIAGSQLGEEPRPEYGYEVEGRHILLTAGLRWWFEWW
jgi:hypothetical protein